MSNTDNNAVEIKNLSKHFILPHQKANTIKSFFINPFSRYKNEKQTAFKDVSFNVKKGEFFGIVGRNGCGKSTLLKCIAGVYSHDTGSIRVNGKLVPFIELGVGFNDELSGRDNVYLNGSLLGFNRKEMDAMYDDIVAFAELEKFMDQRLKNYSSGMQVRLAFSIAIRANADVLLLDEVLAVGDASFQRKCYRYFEDLKGSNTTVILVTHDMYAVQRFCKHAVLLEDGNIKVMGTAQEVTDEYRKINILGSSQTGRPNKKKTETVSVSIISQLDNSIIFSMKHEDEYDKPIYFGFSLAKEGSTFAELNNYNSLKGKIFDKTLKYKIDTNGLNPGVYEINATLFDGRSKEPLAYASQRPQFIIEGSEPNKGGALRLDENWVPSD